MLELYVKMISENVKKFILENQELLNRDIKYFLSAGLIKLTQHEFIELINILSNGGIEMNFEMITNLKGSDLDDVWNIPGDQGSRY